MMNGHPPTPDPVTKPYASRLPPSTRPRICPKIRMIDGVHVNAIDHYLKCIFGLPHDAAMIAPLATQYIDGLDSSERSTRRLVLLNHIADRDCLLGNVLTGSSGAVTANLLLDIADKLLNEAQDPVDSDAWMIAALSQANMQIPFDAIARTRIDVHLCRMLQRHLPELNDIAWPNRPENRWGLDAVEHVRRPLHSQRENAEISAK